MGLTNTLYTLYLSYNIEKLFGNDGYEKSVIKTNGSTVYVYTVDINALEKWASTKNEPKALQLESMILNCGFAFSNANVVILSKHINEFDRNVFMWHEIGHVVNKHCKITLVDIIKTYLNKRPQIINNGVWEKIADKVAYLHTGVKITPMYLVDVLRMTTLNCLGDVEAVNEIYTPENQQKAINVMMQDERFK